ncbi:reverse transcriptase [Lasius niger]|uniref:Reverse transcriptase n=1 Tax=Lasius niger TaxID=67767 RepID=A0A0J7KQY4_LASNI|nr:reverse transcriptase [Lasius niger]
MIDRNIGICAVAEPRRVPDSSLWFASKNGRAAWLYRQDGLKKRCSLIARGDNSVTIKYGDLYLISCYISPNISVNRYLKALEELENTIRTLGRRVIICGDFNAKSPLWGSRALHNRGSYLEDWAAGIGLQVANEGTTPICVRPQGSSIPDITWATAEVIGLIEKWKVDSGSESLSDHKYIEFNINLGSRRSQKLTRRIEPYPRWNWKKLDVSMFHMALEWACAVGKTETEWISVEDRQRWLQRITREACDSAAPRHRSRVPKKQTYWWNESIAEKRRECIEQRRLWTRSKRRQNEREIRRHEQDYTEAKKQLRREIKIAKTKAWQELVEDVNRDPWGLPYLIVLKKLRKSSPGITETMDEEKIDKLLDSLFPSGIEHDPTADWRDLEWNEEEWGVDYGEVERAVKRRRSNNKALGPDGVGVRAIKNVPTEMMIQIAECFQMCMRMGEFPTEWKRAKLALIPKGDPQKEEKEDELPKVRPICLLNEVGKAFERIIDSRIKSWMNRHPEAQISKDQYGFMEGRSTSDALIEVQNIVAEMGRKKGGLTLAVSLDVANAFNSLPWPVIREAMIRKGFPEYIRRIIDSYLSGRTIEYALEGGRIGVKKMTAGVPQGSILGPLLWNIGYDYVLQTELDPGCRVICYADDTMVISTANNMEDLIDKANSMISKVIGRTRELGLKVSPSKTEVVLFYGRTRPKEVAKVTVEGETIVAKDCMKYLGIILDNRLNFKEHFRYIEKKTTKVVRALSGLMPNLKGPGEHKRRLYANVVTSVLTYGAPVWSDALGACKKNQAPLRRLSRTLAVRVVSAHRTISYEAATLLARMPPLPLLARLRKRVYYRLKDLHRKGEWSRETEKEIRAGEELLLRRQWQIHLNDAGLAGARTRDAIRPVLDEQK